MAKDYYEVLGISKDANSEDIKAAYRKLAMKYHPDRNPKDKKQAEEKFKEITEAYQVLGDPEKRGQYDTFGTVGEATDILRNSRTRSVFDDVLRDFGRDGLGFGFLDGIFGEDIVEQFFGDFSMFTAVPRNIVFSEKVVISLWEAIMGAKRILKIGDRKFEMTIPPGTIPLGMGTVEKVYPGARRIIDGKRGDLIVEIEIRYA